MSHPFFDLASLAPLSLDELGNSTAQSTVVLTINNRLSRRLRVSLGEMIRAETTAQNNAVGHTIELPLIVPWSTWLPQLFAQARFELDLDAYRYVLDNFAAQALWVKTIQACEASRNPLLEVYQAAKSAQQADVLVDDWAISVNDEECNDEFSSFMRWRCSYRESLDRLGALDQNTLTTQVIERVKQDDLRLPSTVVLAGFSELSPRSIELIRALQDKQVEVRRLAEPVNEPHSPSCVVLDTHQDEWATAARWAYQQLSSYPEAKFAIIAVNLDADAAHARRVLDDVLKPQDGGFSYNVAVGRPLSEWPLGRAMLLWLNTFVQLSTQQQASAQDLGNALLAGYCYGHVAEAGARALIDARHRSRELINISLEQWQKHLGSARGLGRHWNKAFERWQTDTPTADCAAWAHRFRSSLAALGFPGQRSQSSDDYQVTEALDGLLDRFARLSPVLSEIDCSEALTWLGRLANATVFQPKKKDSAPRLDVLGLLEAEGGHWDAVWILGVSDEAIPAAPSPNPFIPPAALNRVGAPRSTAERELRWAQRLFDHLCACAPEVMTSVPSREGERELRPSPLLLKTAQFVENRWPAVSRQYTPVSLSLIEDSQGPSVAEAEKIAGGASLLATQARNPLWAFFQYRLSVRGLKPYATTPSNSVRGAFIHKILELLWSTLKDQKALIACIEEGEIDGLLATIASEVSQSTLADFPNILKALEIERDVPLIRQWLDVEAKRTPFRVLGVEEHKTFKLGASNLPVSIDRIDQLEGGSEDGSEDGPLIVFDYKSSTRLTPVVNDWASPRPINVQLPLYASILLSELEANGRGVDSLAGLLLVQIHAKQTYDSAKQKSGSVRGIAKDDVEVPGITIVPDEKAFAGADWNAVMGKMRSDIQGLVDEFVQGFAGNESRGLNDLEYCDIKPLLRLYDGAVVDGEDGDGEG